MKNILFFLTILLFSCSDSEKHPPIGGVGYFPTREDSDSSQSQDSSQSAFGLEGTSEPSDEASIDLDAPAPRYWYIYFMAHRKSDESEWSGYKVIKMNESYFDVNKARMELYPNCADGDYVGIQFFKEVSEKTYVEYTKQE